MAWKTEKPSKDRFDRNSANTLIEVDERAFEFQVFAQGGMFVLHHADQVIVHLRFGVLQWRRAVTCDGIFQIEVDLLQLDVLRALRNLRGPEHLNEHSQRARTQDKFADLEKHQSHLYAAGIETFFFFVRKEALVGEIEHTFRVFFCSLPVLHQTALTAAIPASVGSN